MFLSILSRSPSYYSSLHFIISVRNITHQFRSLIRVSHLSSIMFIPNIFRSILISHISNRVFLFVVQASQPYIYFRLKIVLYTFNCGIYFFWFQYLINPYCTPTSFNYSSVNFYFLLVTSVYKFQQIHKALHFFKIQ